MKLETMCGVLKKDPNRFHGGVWLKGKIQNISKQGTASTAVVDLGYKVQTINMTKLHKNPDELHDLVLPPEHLEWTSETFEKWPGIGTNGSPEPLPAKDDSPESPQAPAPGNYQVGGSSSSTSGSVAQPQPAAPDGSPEPPPARPPRRRVRLWLSQQG